MKTSKFTRLVMIACLIIASAGALYYSVTAVGFDVGQSRLSEMAITKLSLTHEVERGPKGDLINSYEMAAVDQKAIAKSQQYEIASAKRTSIKKSAIHKAQGTIKNKPIAKKPAVGKTEPNKSESLKPVPKKPGAGKACPT